MAVIYNRVSNTYTRDDDTGRPRNEEVARSPLEPTHYINADQLQQALSAFDLNGIMPFIGDYVSNRPVDNRELKKEVAPEAAPCMEMPHPCAVCKEHICSQHHCDVASPEIPMDLQIEYGNEVAIRDPDSSPITNYYREFITTGRYANSNNDYDDRDNNSPF